VSPVIFFQPLFFLWALAPKRSCRLFETARGAFLYWNLSGLDHRFGHLQKDGGQKDGGFSVRLRTGPLESA
jgi:hypothetical protein